MVDDGVDKPGFLGHSAEHPVAHSPVRFDYVLAMGKNVLDDKGKALLVNEEIGRLYLGG